MTAVPPTSSVPRSDPPLIAAQAPLLTAIGAAVAIMIGSVSTWVSVVLFAVTGLDLAWGLATLAIGAVALISTTLLYFWNRTSLDMRWSVPVAWCTLPLAATAMAISITIIIRLLTTPKTDLMGIPMGPAIGWGLWLIVVASVVLCASCWVTATQISRSVYPATGHRPTPSFAAWTDAVLPGGSWDARRWQLVALTMSAAAAVALTVLTAFAWTLNSGREQSPEMPAFPDSLFGSEDTETATPAPAPNNADSHVVYGSTCLSSQMNESSISSFSGRELICLPSRDGRYVWQELGPK